MTKEIRGIIDEWQQQTAKRFKLNFDDVEDSDIVNYLAENEVKKLNIDDVSNSTD